MWRVIGDSSAVQQLGARLASSGASYTEVQADSGAGGCVYRRQIGHKVRGARVGDISSAKHAQDQEKSRRKGEQVVVSVRNDGRALTTLDCGLRELNLDEETRAVKPAQLKEWKCGAKDCTCFLELILYRDKNS